MICIRMLGAFMNKVYCYLNNFITDYPDLHFFLLISFPCIMYLVCVYRVTKTNDFNLQNKAFNDFYLFLRIYIVFIVFYGILLLLLSKI